jgi:hypothetical protein
VIAVSIVTSLRRVLLYLFYYFFFLFLFLDGTSATTSSSSPNQSQLSLPGLVAFSANEPMNPNSINNINNNNSASTQSGSNKSRSHSTTSLYNQHPNGKRLMRERKTVCSLHPLSSTTPTPNEYSSSTGLLLPDNASNCPGLVPNDSEALQQQQQQHLRDRDDSENEAFSYSLPGSAVDSRRGSGLSTRYDHDRRPEDSISTLLVQ